MEKTSITHDGTVITYSDAHQALEAYSQATYNLILATEEAMASEAARRQAKEALSAAQATLLDALQAHYGQLPEALNDHSATLIFETDDEGITTIRRITKPASVVDLYRCDRPIEPTPLYHEPEAA